MIKPNATIELIYQPQVEHGDGRVELAKFTLLVNGNKAQEFNTNYTPSRAFPLEEKMAEITKMLIHEEAWEGVWG